MVLMYAYFCTLYTVTVSSLMSITDYAEDCLSDTDVRQQMEK